MAKNFAKNNFLHHEIAQRICENIELFDRDFDSMLEITALDQYLSNLIKEKKKIKENFCTNLVKNFPADFVVDDENLDFPQEKFDLIVSNLNLHFINDVVGFLTKIKSFLKPDGVFIASFFGEENLLDLKKAVFDAENTIYNAVSPRIIPTIDLKNSAFLLQKVGFKNPVASLENIEIEYDNVLDFLRDLKNMGQGNILNLRSRRFASRKFLDEILKNYAIIAQSAKSCIKARFDVIIMVGKK